MATVCMEHFPDRDLMERCGRCGHTVLMHQGEEGCAACRMYSLVAQVQLFLEEAGGARLVGLVRELAGVRQEARDVQVLTSPDPLVRQAGVLVDAVVEGLVAQGWGVGGECDEPHCDCDTAHRFGCECY